jgi:hypothetical protein
MEGGEGRAPPEGVIRKRNVQPVLPCGGGKHRWRSKVNPLLIPRAPKTLVLTPPAFAVLAHHRVVPWRSGGSNVHTHLLKLELCRCVVASLRR